MIDSRSYILDRLKSKTVSIEEFNFDLLQGPFVSNILPLYDIYELDKVSLSISLSAKPLERERIITEIMNRNGFVKFYSGTNRISFRPIEDNSYIVKIALDNVGRSDAIREFQNQQIKKPFVCKIFDVYPGGAISTVERVIPITSADEFRSIASDVYEVINDWFIGDYVMEDIGSEFFMNWGIRKGFGPVLLDYPYMYKLDGNKLYCNVQNPASPTGTCDGVIDYDAGYNHLYCTKCGVMYRASELKEAIKNNIIKTKGDSKMKVRIQGGSLNTNAEIEVGGSQFARDVKIAPTRVKTAGGSTTGTAKSSSKKSSSKKKEEDKKKTEIKTGKITLTTEVKSEESKISPIKINDDSEYADKKDVSVASVIEDMLELGKDDLFELFKYIADHDDDKQKFIDYLVPESDRVDKKEVVSPVEFDESLIKEHEATTDPIEVKEEEETGIAGHLALIDLLLGNIQTAKEGNDVDTINDILHSDLLKELVALTDIKITPCDLYYDEEGNLGVFEISIILVDKGSADGDMNWDPNSEENFEHIVLNLNPDDFYIGFDPSSLISIIEAAGIAQYSGEVKSEGDVVESDDTISGFHMISAVIKNMNEIDHSADSKKILALISDNGNCLRDSENYAFAVDVIDNHSVDAISIVPTNWLNGVVSKAGAVEEDEKEQEEAQSDNNEENGTTTAPTGVFAPNNVEMSVNGVPVKED
jgi:hypothetical protein